MPVEIGEINPQCWIWTVDTRVTDILFVLTFLDFFFKWSLVQEAQQLSST